MLAECERLFLAARKMVLGLRTDLDAKIIEKRAKQRTFIGNRGVLTM
jgi:hypothetical protein